MKCYYEILNVSRDADFSEIKSNYRKCALKWHPDKNLDNPDYAKEQFQLVQQAYEVLSDPLERSWYDKHRDQIIFGSNTDYEDNSLNVYQYFTSSCFKGYNDNDDGFYTIYRKVFDQIIEEDLPFIEDKDEIQLIPRFGYSNSDYDEIVAPFYSYWSSYCTRKNYAWLDPFDITHLKHGKLAKLNEKEFKKIRQMAKKERNEEIRSLVSFIRKRDKRVQVNKKKIEDKIIMNREKQQKLRKQKIIDRKKELESCDNIEAEWSKFDNLISQLEEIERNLTDDDDEQSDNMDLYCVACNKVFKTKKTFQNHEASKKHKENVEILTQVMLKEETSISVIILNSEDSLDSDFSISEDEEENLEKLSKTKKKQKKTRGLKVDISKIEEDINLDNLENTLESSNKKKKKISVVPPSTKINKPQEEPSDELKIPIKRDKHEKKESIKNKTKVNGKDTTNIDLAHCCVTCRAEFPSKNKLFNHLKKTGHGVYINPKLKNKIK